MKKSFKNFAENIRLTENQEKDAKIKYTNGADYSDYNLVIRDCFIYLKEIADDSTLSFIAFRVSEFY